MSGYDDDDRAPRGGDRGGDRRGTRGGGRDRDDRDGGRGDRGGDRDGGRGDRGDRGGDRGGGDRGGERRSGRGNDRDRSPRRRDDASRSASEAAPAPRGNRARGKREDATEDAAPPSKKEKEPEPAEKKSGDSTREKPTPDKPEKKKADKAETKGEDTKKSSTSDAPINAEDDVPHLNVSTCRDATISAIIKGNYTAFSSNHERTVYRKDDKSKGIDVFIYYWDDRDGEDLCGWWFSPAVGGDEVWAYHPSRSHKTPPLSDWNVPHDGAIDPVFRVSPRTPGEDEPAKKEPAKEEPVKEAAAQEPRSKDKESRKRQSEKEKDSDKVAETADSDPYGPPPTQEKADADDEKPAKASREEAAPREDAREGGRRGGDRRGDRASTRGRGERGDRDGDDRSREPRRGKRGDRGDDKSKSRDAASKPREAASKPREAASKPREEGLSDARKRLQAEREAEKEKEKELEKEKEKKKEEKESLIKMELRKATEARQAARAAKTEEKDDSAAASRPSKFASNYEKRLEEMRRKAEEGGGGKKAEDEKPREEKTPEKDEAPARHRGEESPPARSRDDAQKPAEDEPPSRRRGDASPPARRGGDRQTPAEDRKRGDDDRERSRDGGRGGDRGGDRRGERGGDRAGDRGGDRAGDRGDRGGRGGGDRRDGDRGGDRGDRGGRGDRRDEGGDDRRGGRAEEPRGGRRGGRDEEPARRGEEDRRGGGRGEDDRRPQRGGRADDADEKPAEKPAEDNKKQEENKRMKNLEDQKREEEQKREREEKEEKQREEDRRRREKEDEEAKRKEMESKEDDGEREKRKADVEAQRKAKEEEMKRKDEELQKKRAAKRAEEDEKRKVIEEQHAAKRREEMANRSEEQKKKDAIEAAKQEVIKKQKEEEAAAVKQQQATLSVLQVLQKLSSASPENFEELKKELDKVLENELPLCGAQQEILAAEAQRVVDYAKQYVGQVLEQREADDKAKREEVESKMKSENTARDLLGQLEKLVVAAEEASENVYQTAAPLLDAVASVELEDDDVMKIAATVHKQGRAAMAACSFCADFITTKRPTIQEAESMQAESTAAIAALLPRIKLATRRTAEAFQKGKENRTIVCKRTSQKRAIGKNKALFEKYNSKGDSLFTIEDLKAYAKGEYSFDVPEVNLKRVESQLFPLGAAGLGFDSFPMLRTVVGIARTEVSGRERNEEKKKRKEVVEARRQELSKRVAELMALLQADDSTVCLAEAEAEVLAKEAGNLESKDLKERALAVEAVTLGTKAKVADLRQTGLTIVNEANAMPELETLMKAELNGMDARISGFETRLNKASEMASSGRQLALFMAVSEYEGLWTEVVVKLRSFIEKDDKTIDDLFSVIAGHELVGTTTAEDIHNYMKTHDPTIELAKVQKLFCRRFATPPKPVADGDAEMTSDKPSDASEKKESEKKEADADVPMDDKAKDDAGDKEAAKAAEEPAEEEPAEEEEDEYISKTDLEAMTVVALKQLCKGQGLGIQGVKADLVERLSEVHEAAKKEKDSKKEAAAAAKAAAKAAKEAKAKEAVAEEAKAKEEAEAAKKAEEAKAKEEAEAAKAKEQPADRPANEVTKDEFNKTIRMYYKVSRQCVLSDNLLIEKSAQIRRMEVGEVIEVHKGPCMDSSVGVYRLLGRAIKDSTVGWATIAGNQGITFLMPGGRTFSVKVVTPLTADLKDLDGTGPNGTVRLLQEGEFLEVMEWARTSQSALGVTRIQARAHSDGAVGWATVVGNDASVYLEAM